MPVHQRTALYPGQADMIYYSITVRYFVIRDDAEYAPGHQNPYIDINAAGAELQNMELHLTRHSPAQNQNLLFLHHNTHIACTVPFFRRKISNQSLQLFA